MQVATDRGVVMGTVGYMSPERQKSDCGETRGSRQDHTRFLDNRPAQVLDEVSDLWIVDGLK